MKRYAFVIGIGKYANLNELSKPASDAQAVAEVLKKHGDFQEVTLLNGTKAKPGWVDYDTLDAELTKFLKQADIQDALIYFTGHGFTVEESEFDQRGYLATSSSKVKFKGKQIISQEDGFSFNKLNGLVQKASLSSLLLLMDCCHSGFLIEDDLVKQSLQAFSKSNYFLISACRSFQEAYALKRETHSIFTGALLESLLPEQAKQGVVTALNALDFIDRELKGSGQEPIFLGMGGAIPVVSYAIAAPIEPDETCPYQGLEAFTEATARFFFGRQTDVEALWQKLEKSAFVPVIGASGSGKSSLVRAGLIPALQQSGTNWTVLEPIKPGEEPLTQLRKPLESLTQQLTSKVQLANLLRKAPEGLQPLLQQLPDTARFLLVVDQFEEVFTVCLDEAEQARFIQLVTQVATMPHSRLSVVITMRADFVESCLHYEALKQLIQTQAVYLSPLTGADLTDAIAKPAEQQGYHLTSALLAEIVKDTREEPGFLPLLQFALTKLWECRDSEAHALTAGAYVTIGELAGALDAHADQIYECCEYIDPYTGEINLSAEQNRSQIEQDWIRAILLRLVRSGEGEKDTRQRQPRSTLVALAGETPEAQQQIGLVLESLIKGRLLVSERETIDLAHEALIKGWKRLDGWCQESRELRRWSQRLEAARLEWEKDQQNPNLKPAEKDRNLMMGGLLAEVREQWQALIPYLQDLSKDEPFWQRSDAHEQDRITTLQRALTESRLREMSARSQHLVLAQPRMGLELAMQAMGENLENFPAQLFSTVQGSLHQALDLARLPETFQGHGSSVRSVAFSSDGKTLVSGSDDDTIRLWSLDGTPLGQPFQGHQDHVRSVAFSPDGQMIVSGSSDKTIRLWSLDGTPLGQPFQGHQNWVNSVAFSPDGQAIVSGSDDNTIRLWSLNGAPIGQPFQGHQGSVNSVAFSPDGKTVVSGSNDNTIRLWSLNGAPIGQPFQGHQGSVNSVAFSPDGKTVVSGSNDNTIRLWSLDGTPMGQPPSRGIKTGSTRWRFPRMARPLSVAVMTTRFACGASMALRSGNPSRGIKSLSTRWRFPRMARPLSVVVRTKRFACGALMAPR
ncbi:caspase family protein [Phormidium sp. CLA17]|nr:caspase family protein [Leptolyngbya sp. Cla-17]MBM0744079.1 caspase family protein [Leptolyngbya sp. Cla-17]